MKTRAILLIGFVLVLVITQAAPLHAEWIDDGVPIVIDGVDQKSVQTCSDGNGGAYITWHNYNGRVYAQRIDADGNLLWPSEIRVCTYESTQEKPRITAGYANTAIIAWEDDRKNMPYDTDIYAARVLPDGSLDTYVNWSEEGLPVCTENLYQRNIAIVSVGFYDGFEGAVIAWEDWRDDLGYPRIYAQRLDIVGRKKWRASEYPQGLPISIDRESTDPRLMSTDRHFGCAMVVYRKHKLDDTYDIMATRIDENGYLHNQWEGVPDGEATIFGGTYNNDNPQVAPGPIEQPNNIERGAIIVCEYDDGGTTRIRKQRILSYPLMLWGSGSYLCPDCRSSQTDPQLATDAYGVPIVVCRDFRGGTENIYAQKLDHNYGTLLWDPMGVPVCTSASGSRGEPQISSARYGGAIVTWWDGRLGSSNKDIYAQMLKSSDGTALWTGNGHPVSTADKRQDLPVITTDGSGGALIAWLDERNGSYHWDIYAGRVIPEMACDITWENIDNGGQPTGYDILVGCPAGDHHALKVYLDFNEDIMAGEIAADEITLDKPDGSVSFWNVGDIHADDPAAGPDYETTITHGNIGGCNLCTGEPCDGPIDIAIRLNGLKIGQVSEFEANGFDMNNDGLVALVDFAMFAMSYGKSIGDPAFNPCADYNFDEMVALVDFALFAMHYGGCSAPGNSTPMFFTDPSSGVNSRATLNATLSPTGDGRLAVSLSIGNAGDVSGVLLGLEISRPDVEFQRWIPAREFAGNEVTAILDEHGHERTVIAALSAEKPLRSGSVLGVIEFSIDADSKLSNGDLRFMHVDGGIIEPSGQIRYIETITLDRDKTTPKAGNYLADNYPNPFNPATTIEYAIATDSHVNLSIYNAQGQRVRTLVNEFKSGDVYRIMWDGKDNSGNAVASGIYFYELTTNAYRASKKLVLLR